MCDIILTTGILKDFLRDFPHASKQERKRLAKAFSHIHHEPIVCKDEGELSFKWPRDYGGE